MSNRIKDKLKLLYDRIKKVKHFEIYLAVGLALIVVIVYFSCIKSPPSTKE